MAKSIPTAERLQLQDFEFTHKNGRTYRSESLAKRFWRKVKKTEGCWFWTGCKRPRGYGQIRLNRKGDTEDAHRVSYMLHYGPIPSGKDVLHDCDNPPCVRPDHLFLGTQAENMQDMTKKGRRARGEKIGTAKHTEAQIIEIRQRYAKGGITQKQLAVEYGYSSTASLRM